MRHLTLPRASWRALTALVPLLLVACGDEPLAPSARRAVVAPALALVPGPVAMLPSLDAGLAAQEDYASDIAADGRIVGFSMLEDGRHRAVVWHDGAVTALPVADADHETFAFGVSANGRYVAGVQAPMLRGDWRPVLWTDGGAPQPLLPASIEGYGQAIDVNDAGMVLGTYDAGEGAYRAFVWQAGVFRDLGTLGGAYSSGVAINNAGQVVGMSETLDDGVAPFLWSGGVMQRLPDIDGLGAEVTGINDAGMAVGLAFRDVYAYSPAMWNGATAPTLVPMAEGRNARFLGVNNAGLFVGIHEGVSDGPSWNFVWAEGESLTELPEHPASAYTPSVAALNDAGVIVGAVAAGDADTRALRWAPVARGGANQAPTASAGGPYPTIVEGASVAFAGSGTDPDGDALSYAWSFGDGATGTGKNVSYVYGDNGTYTATLTVTDAKGASATSSATIVVTNAAPVFRTLKLDYAILNMPRAGQTFPLGVAWSDRGTHDGWTWTIEWGDGTRSTGAMTMQAQVDAAHKYATPGLRNARFTLRDKDGGSFTRAIPVVVQP